MDGGLQHCTGGSDQNHPQERKMKEGKMVVWGDLKTTAKRREAKGKGERDIPLNAQFQRIPRRDKKDLSEKCKEMRKTIEWERRDLFKKIRDTKGAFHASSVPFSSITQSCPTFCDPMNCSTPGLPVHHYLPEFTQTHVHQVGDAIQPSHPLSSPFPPAPNPSLHQSLFQWINSSHEVAKVLEFQL